MFTGRTDAEAEAPIPWPPDEKSWLIVKDPDSGKIRAGEGGDRWLDCTIDSMDMSLSNLWETVKDREAWHTGVHGVSKSCTWLSDWTATTKSNWIHHQLTYIIRNKRQFFQTARKFYEKEILIYTKKYRTLNGNQYIKYFPFI